MDRLRMAGTDEGLAEHQLIVSGAAVGTELNEIHLDNENVERYLSVPIQHAPYCPAAALDDMKPLAAVATDAASSRAIRAAVSILVINNEGKVLLTRRGKTMRAFPGFWVLPGELCNPAYAPTECPVLTSRGHVDPNERLCEVACPPSPHATAMRCPVLTYYYVLSLCVGDAVSLVLGSPIFDAESGADIGYAARRQRREKSRRRQASRMPWCMSEIVPGCAALTSRVPPATPTKSAVLT
eukprot:3228639-Rhodomonas_salina.2